MAGLWLTSALRLRIPNPSLSIARNVLKGYLKRQMKKPTRTTISAVVWLSGIAMCLLFVGLLLPMEGPPGHRWVMYLGFRGNLFFGGGCFLILLTTYFLDKFLTRQK